jgi:hypothetical protein
LNQLAAKLNAHSHAGGSEGCKSAFSKACPSNETAAAETQVGCLKCLVANRLGLIAAGCTLTAVKSICSIYHRHLPTFAVDVAAANGGGAKECTLCGPGHRLIRAHDFSCSGIEGLERERAGLDVNDGGGGDGGGSGKQRRRLIEDVESMGARGTSPGLCKYGLGCKACSSGQYGTDGLTCTPCGPNQHQGQQGQRLCLWCAAGRYRLPNMRLPVKADVAGNASSGTCWPCPRGRWRMQFSVGKCNTQRVQGGEQPKGQTDGEDEAGSSLGGAIDPLGAPFLHCPPGKYSPMPGQIECNRCAAGKTTVRVGAECTATHCAKGKYFLAAAKGGLCLLCPSGKFAAAEGSLGCTACTVGQHQPDSGKAACEADPVFGTVYGHLSGAGGNWAREEAAAGTKMTTPPGEKKVQENSQNSEGCKSAFSKACPSNETAAAETQVGCLKCLVANRLGLIAAGCTLTAAKSICSIYHRTN